MHKPGKEWMLFFAVAAVFLAIKVASAHYAVSDENTYYKAGQLVADGQVPYRDFFFAHLPLQVYIYAAVFKLFGFSILLLKMLSAIAAAAAAAFVFAAVKARIGKRIAIAAATLFLFSYGTLLFSNFPTGAEFAVAFITASFYFFMQKRFLLSGLLLGLGTAAYQLSAVILIALVTALLAMKDRRAAVKLLAGFAAVLILISVPFLIAAKGEFIRQVLLYHFQKTAEAADKPAVLFRIIKTNLLLFAAAAIAIVSKHRNKIGVVMPVAIAASYLAVFLLAGASFNYYLLCAFPFLAIAGSYGMLAAHEFMAQRLKLSNIASAAVIAAIILIMTQRLKLTNLASAAVIAAIILITSQRIKLSSLASAAVIVTIILVSSFAAVKGFVGYDSQDFPQAAKIADYVKENSREGQTIFGDDSTTPLISLLSGREIALNYVDNNALRYSSGETSLDETLAKLESSISRKELKFIVVRKIILDNNRSIDFGISTLQRFADFTKKCSLAKEFAPEQEQGLASSYLIYDCQPGSKNSTAA